VTVAAALIAATVLRAPATAEQQASVEAGSPELVSA